eukprot:304376_1
MKKSQRALYAQISNTAEYGIIPSSQTESQPQWTTITHKSQNLASQLPQSPKFKQEKLSMSEEYKIKMVHEWTEGDVSSWLRSILTPYFSSQNTLSNAANDVDNNISNYVWCFSQKQVDGMFILLKINCKKDIINKIMIDSNSNINESVIKIIYNSIVKLRKKAKKEIRALHPMKQSNLDEILISKYAQKKKSINISLKTNQNNFICLQITNNRYHRISIMCLMLLIFCIVLMFDFIPNKDFGGIFSMILFLFGNIIIIYTLYKENKNANNKLSVSMAISKNDELIINNDSDNEDFEYEHSDYKRVSNRGIKRTWTQHKDSDKQFYDSNKYKLSIGKIHILAIFCILFGCMTLIVSRWIKMSVNNSNNNQWLYWLYGFGIGIYIGGLGLILLCDLSFLKLFDDHNRRIRCYYFINFIYYLLIIGYYAINGKGLISLGIIVILSLIISFIVIIVTLFPRCVAIFTTSIVRIILPISIFVIHVITIGILLIQYKWKFYPIADKSSISGSVAFIILTTMFTIMISIDSSVFKKVAAYEI